MSELELYKFCQHKELDWRGNELILWIDFNDIGEFTDLIGYDHFCEGGMEVTLLHTCIAFDLVDICESYDIEPTNIFPKKEG